MAAAAILYCSVCDTLLRTAVVLPCCQSPCCSACASGGAVAAAPDGRGSVITCQVCGKRRPLVSTQPSAGEEGARSQVEEALRQDQTVRRVTAAVSTRCPNEGCGAIMRQDEVNSHRFVCSYEPAACVFAEEGCTVTAARRDIRDHQTLECPYRTISCPQRCGASLTARDVGEHIDADCPRTLIPCPSRCGQDMQRGLAAEHDSVCPVRPRSCPYRPYGCAVHGAMSEAQLRSHMAVSINAHLALLDGFAGRVGTAQMTGVVTQGAGGLCSRGRLWPGRFDWDAASVQTAAKWPAQPNTISALAVVGAGGADASGEAAYVISGCERGTLLAFGKTTGEVAARQAAGASAVRCLVGTPSGRLYVGFSDCSVQAWMPGSGGADGGGPIAHRVAQQMVTPARRHATKGVAHIAIVRLPRTLLAARTGLLGPDGEAAGGVLSSTIVSIASPMTPSRARSAAAQSLEIALSKLSDSTTSANASAFLATRPCCEVVACLVDERIALLEATMLQLAASVPLFPEEGEGRSGADSTNDSPQSPLSPSAPLGGRCMAVVAGRWAFVGCSDGSLRCADLLRVAADPSSAATAARTVDRCVFPSAGRSADAAGAIVAIAPLDLRASAYSDLAASDGPSVVLAMGSEAGGIVVRRYALDAAACEWAPMGGAEGSTVREMPKAHKGPVRSLLQVDGRHLASGGADECWRLWGPPLPIALTDDDGRPLQVPAVDLPSSMYACVVADGSLYAAGGQGVVKEWVATTTRYAAR